MSEEFVVPEDYELEPELRVPLPRPVPDEIRHHPTRLRRHARVRLASALLLLAALTLWFGGSTTPVQLLKLYFPPLEWSNVVGPLLALTGLWGLTLWARPGKADPFRYLRHGVPVVGRVIDLRNEVTVTVNGSPSQFAYDLYVQHEDAKTGEPTISRMRTLNGHPSYTALKCRVGDWVTALYLPGEYPSSLQLYGLTGVNPERELVQDVRTGRTRWLGLLALLGVFAFVGAIFRYPPSHDGDGRVLGIGLAVLAAVGLVVAEVLFRRTRARQQELMQQALEHGTALRGQTHGRPGRLGAYFLGLVLAPMLGFALFAGVNGFFDARPPQVEPVKFKQVWQTTHNFVFSTYEIEFVDPHGTTRKLGISPLTLVDDRPKVLQLVTHPGALGVSWEELRATPAEP